MPVMPPTWSKVRLDADRQQAIELFREERLTEPLEDYLGFFQTSREAMENILELTDDLRALRRYAPDVMSDEDMAEAARFLAAPPISKDDLETTAGVTMARTLIQREPDRGRLLIDSILAALDRERFPWVSEARYPTESEREAAIVASAALRATNLAGTRRRTTGKNEQEGAVKNFLRDACGYSEAPALPIPHLHAAPDPGKYCGEVLVGTRLSDVPIRLWDGRLMPTECKVSNSATNSYKRINNDAAVKSVVWRQEFGTTNVVPVAILSGVFALSNLEYAQEHGLTLFWAHDLDPMRDFIESTR